MNFQCPGETHSDFVMIKAFFNTPQQVTIGTPVQINANEPLGQGAFRACAECQYLINLPNE